MLGTLIPIQIDKVLKEGLLGRIGCSGEGKTYVVPISYAYDGNFIYCHTHEGLKTKMMRENPNICFEVEEMKDMANWKSEGHFMPGYLMLGKIAGWTDQEIMDGTNQRMESIKKMLAQINN